MGWLLIFTFAGAGLAGLRFFGRLTRSAFEFAAAALLLGVAGYAWQGSPLTPGNPVAAADEAPLPPELAELSIRKVMSSKFGAEGQWIDLSDALIKAGRSQTAVSILGAGVKKSPNNPDLWVALGNALVVHGGGQINPASQFAFERAAKLSPNHPGPPFFLGLAMMQSGKVEEAGEIWRALLARAPEGAPWRADLERRLNEIGQMVPPTALAKP
ncbi:MAG: tetratricopeptide repeat protein [Sphingomonadaceae bacterium]